MTRGEDDPKRCLLEAGGAVPRVVDGSGWWEDARVRLGARTPRG